MFKRILVPIDGSPAAALGLDQAIELAAEQNSTLLLLHVVDEAALVSGMDASMYVPATFVEGFLDALRESGEKILASARDRAAARGVACDTAIQETLGRRVATVILAHAQEAQADLIVMGTHGRRGFARLVMGSDAEGVLHEARVPVMLVRDTARSPAEPAAKAASIDAGQNEPRANKHP